MNSVSALRVMDKLNKFSYCFLKSQKTQKGLFEKLATLRNMCVGSICVCFVGNAANIPKAFKLLYLDKALCFDIFGIHYPFFLSLLSLAKFMS